MDLQLIERVIAAFLFGGLLLCTYCFILPDSVHRLMWFRGRRQIREILKYEKNPTLKKQKQAQMRWLGEQCDMFESQTLVLIWFSLWAALSACLCKIIGYVPDVKGFILLAGGGLVSTTIIINLIKMIPLSKAEMDIVFWELSTVLPPADDQT